MIVAVIPAKGDSIRLPNKNMLKINNKSLIEHAVQYAKKTKKIDDIYISTDSKDIAEHGKQLGINVIERGSDLGGETPLIDVYRHAWKNINDKRITYIVGIQPDNPDRTIDVDSAIDFATENKIDNFFSVDSKGRRNGAINIYNINALRANPFVYSSTIRDDCTNIHTTLDFYLASRNLSPDVDIIEINGRPVGKSQPTFIIAEAACNHMCDMNLAKKMINRAADAGADAIKFQTYKAELLVTKEAVAFWGDDTLSQIDYYRRLDRFGKEEYKELFNYANKKNIVAFSSPFDEPNARMLDDIGMPLFKIASCEIPNLRLIRLVAEFGKPVIMSTGASTLEEIDQAVEEVFSTGNYKLILLACTLSYPTKYEDANFLRIRALVERYPGITIGISDHTEPDPHMIVPATAVALGARVVEKHYTLDRTMTGSGHFFAVNPDDLKRMVNNIRLTEKVLGTGKLGVSDWEKKAWESARRSIVAECAIKKGDVISLEMLGVKRPAGGMPANMLDFVIGKRAKKDIALDERISMEMLEQ